jgi:hypothetical protein
MPVCVLQLGAAVAVTMFVKNKNDAIFNLEDNGLPPSTVVQS